jgi:hypothetical protein
MRFITSVSLPENSALCWQANKREIMLFAERYLRLCMRKEFKRAVTRRYNRSSGALRRVTTRFTAAEYDTLHYVAATLRMSVSLLIHGLICLWLKPARRAQGNPWVSNYSCAAGKWDPEAGMIEEEIVFWRRQRIDLHHF